MGTRLLAFSVDIENTHSMLAINKNNNISLHESILFSTDAMAAVPE